MSNLKTFSKESYVNGVKNAVKQMEKNASFCSWMNNKKFKEMFTEKTSSLITKVKN